MQRPRLSFAGVITIIRDPLDGDQFQSQFADERLYFLPVFHGDIFQHSFVLALLLPAHGALRLLSSRPPVVLMLLFLLDGLGLLGRLGLVLLNRLVAICLR